MIEKIKITVTTLCCLMLAGCANQEVQPVVQKYSSMKITRSDASFSDVYPASVEGRQDIKIMPEISGTISKVCVKEGQLVTKGQSLFIIDQVPFKAALNIAQADVQSAKAEVETAQLVYESRKALFEDEVISMFELKTSFIALKSAETRLAQAKAQLVIAEDDFSDTKVESPADGVVGTIPMREGALVSPQMQTPLTTVSDNSEVYVYFSVSENKFLDMISKYGDMKEVLDSLPNVRLLQSNGTYYSEPGYVETISGVIDKNTGSISFRAVFPNKGRLLRSGASGKVTMTREVKNCIVIPALATFEIQDVIMAYKYENGKTKAVKLTVQNTDDAKNYIVLSGLEEGDTIITEGVSMLRDGETIAIKEAE